ncbi:NACHT domain-containing protein [Streptomyces sp. NPDC000070]|uniref:NACHT domain-containing protein n=1 Tax=Streptomyces sp. NPDC000070 TaxID=3154240 RepID=UPI0033291236
MTVSTHGGRANELGSLHRSGFAALLASYGLRGIALPYFDEENGRAFVKALQFETADHVDDVCCVMTDGTKALFQAKRSCGADTHLTSTVEQWVSQADHIEEGMRICLVVREMKGVVKDLPEALRTYRSAYPGISTKKNSDAINAIRKRFPENLSPEKERAILSSAYVIRSAADRFGDIEFNLAVALLDGAVVSEGSGVAAVELLQRKFQERAGSGLGSDISDWVAWLRNSGVDPLEDAHPSPAAREAAKQREVASFLGNLKNRAGVLHFAVLAEDVPPLEVERLAESFRVSLTNTEGEEETFALIDVARRHRRFFLLGLPGTGKSTALEQVAALWAQSADAPLPILVPLKRVAERVNSPADLTLDLLIDVALGETERNGRHFLRCALTESAERGTIVLLLDGLDECGRLKGIVADGLSQLIEGAHPHAAVIVTGRDSAKLAGRKLSLPEARLCEPSWLESTMKNLLEVVSKARIEERGREQWLEARWGWIEQCKNQHPKLWAVPLLSTLLTLLAADRSDSSLPGSRAKILYEVVRDSVQKWESGRQGGEPPGGWSPSLESEQLLDGFAEIGHTLICSHRETGTSRVASALHEMLRDRWDCSAGRSRVIASNIQWFWDQQVGVFVSTDAGHRVEARSRQFEEIAEAIWITRQEEGVAVPWVASALLNEEMRESVLLACGLSEEIPALLMDAAGTLEDIDLKLRAYFWLISSQMEEITLSSTHLTALIEQVCNLYEMVSGRPVEAQEPDPNRRISKVEQIFDFTSMRQLKVDGAGWKHLVSLAQLKLPSEVRTFRSNAILRLCLDGDKSRIIKALLALSEAEANDRGLQDEEIATVRELLERPLEKAQSAYRKKSRRSYSIVSGDPLLSGHYEVAARAVKFLDSLGPTVHDHLAVVAQRGPASGYSVIAKPLREHGVQMQSLWSNYSIPRIADILGEDEPWDAIYRSAVSAGGDIRARRSDLESDPDSRWWMTELADFMNVIGVSSVGVGDYREAVTQDQEDLTGLFAVLAECYGLDIGAIAAQADLVLQDPNRRENFRFLTAGIETLALDAKEASPTAIAVLVKGLSSMSRWPAWLCYVTLALLQDERSLPGLAPLLHSATPWRRKHAVVAFCLSSPNPVAECQRYFLSEDPALRAGVALLTRMSTDSIFDPIRTMATQDQDMTVRLAASGSEEIAKGGSFWSCSDCTGINSINDLDCSHCPTGHRP